MFIGIKEMTWLRGLVLAVGLVGIAIGALCLKSSWSDLARWSLATGFWGGACVLIVVAVFGSEKIVREAASGI